MTIGPVESLYETLRAWALHPTSVRPPGWMQILGGGLARWMQVIACTPAVGSSRIALVHSERPGPADLPRLLAAMIAEVSS